MSSSSPQMKRPRADATPGQRADGSWSFFDLSPATKRQLLTSKLVDRAIRQQHGAPPLSLPFRLLLTPVRGAGQPPHGELSL